MRRCFHPARCLAGLARTPALPDGARILDAGCGLGDGLVVCAGPIRMPNFRAWNGSWMWWAVCALRRPWARVRRGDMWAQDWAELDVVSPVSAPETMPRAWAQARQSMKPGAWLVSLEFAATDERGRTVAQAAQFNLASGRPIWVYRLPLVQARQGPSTLRA